MLIAIVEGALKVTETPLSKKLSSIAALLNPNAMRPQIISANAQLMSLVKDVKTLEEENVVLKAKIQEFSSGK